jgi:hypothetical protein
MSAAGLLASFSWLLKHTAAVQAHIFCGFGTLSVEISSFLQNKYPAKFYYLFLN